MGFDILISIFWFIFVLSILIFVHELGHFLAAKLSGIRVERFSIGYPPRLFGKKIGETDYCISLTPLGGYCKMAGMIDESLDPDGIKGEPWEFLSKPIPIRMFAIFGGPFFNFVFAIALFAGLVMYTGVPVDNDSSSKIGAVNQNTAAERAELKAGDIIIAVDEQSVSTWRELTGLISSKPLETVKLTIDRQGEILEKSVTIDKRDNPTDDIEEEVGMLGIVQSVITEDIGFFASIEYGFDQTWYLTKLVAGVAKSIITGKESVKALGGPLMIAKFTDESRKSGIGTLIRLMAYLSLNLGFINLLPIPVFDGGHLVILSAEAISRRQLPVKAKIIIQQIGLALILGLIVMIFYNDIMRFVSPS